MNDNEEEEEEPRVKMSGISSIPQLNDCYVLNFENEEIWLLYHFYVEDFIIIFDKLGSYIDESDDNREIIDLKRLQLTFTKVDLERS